MAAQRAVSGPGRALGHEGRCGLAVLPVNYRPHEQAIVFRSAVAGILASLLCKRVRPVIGRQAGTLTRSASPVGPAASGLVPRLPAGDPAP